MRKVVFAVDDPLSDWESIIDAVDKSIIPLEFVNSVNIEFTTPVNGEHHKNIDVFEFRLHGWSNPDIEEIIQTVIAENSKNIKLVGFMMDIKGIAHTAQLQTDTILREVK